MSSLPSPPPSPLDRRRHRRGDSFALLQAIIKEREKEEHKEEEIVLQSKLIRFSCPPKIEMMDNNIDIIPRKSLSHHSVRFTTEPPKVYHYTV